MQSAHGKKSGQHGVGKINNAQIQPTLIRANMTIIAA
jgi:hypothetical protein